MYIIFCIISPFVDSSGLFDFGNIEEYVQSSVPNVTEQIDQSSMDKRLEKLYIEEIEKDIEKHVETHGYKISKCNIDADLKGISENPGIHSINLILKKNSIVDIEQVEINIGNKENSFKEEQSQDAEEIKIELAKNYQIRKDIIKIKISQ